MKLAKGLQPIGMFSYSIPNEYVLLVGVLVLIALISWEYYDTQVLLTFGNGKQEERIKSPHAMKIENELGTSENASCASDEYVEYPQSTTQTAEVLSSIEIIPNSNTNTSSDTEQDRDTQRISIYRERISISTSVVNLAPKELSEEEVKKMVNKIMDPLPPGCEPFGPNADLMSEKFSQLTRPDIVRYLVARKGNVTMALEMAEKCLEWRLTVFPLKRDDLSAAVATGCFFPYKTARDGTPCVYMRGGLYDNAKATPEQFVLAASYAIEYSLRTHPDQINVTVVVDTVIIPGAPNLGADMTFIKLFVKVCIYLLLLLYAFLYRVCIHTSVNSYLFIIIMLISPVYICIVATAVLPLLIDTKRQLPRATEAHHNVSLPMVRTRYLESRQGVHR